MRRLAAVLAVLTVPCLAVADPAPGTFKLAGTSGYTFSRTESGVEGSSSTQESSRHGLDLKGYGFLTDNVGVGVWFGGSREKRTLTVISAGTGGGAAGDGVQEVELTQTSFLAGPAVLVQIPVAPKLHAYAEGAYLFSRSRTAQEGEPDTEADGHGFGLGAGIAYLPAQWISLDLGVGFTRVNDTFSSAEVNSDILKLGVGISVYFGGP